jgi:Putative addiction module component
MERVRGERGKSGLHRLHVTTRSPMPRSIENLLKELPELPPEERARIARAILSSLNGDASDDEAWEKEILRTDKPAPRS